MRANGLYANIPREASGGHSIHIGVIDSAYKLPGANHHNLVQQKKHAYISEEQPEMTSHASNVLSQLTPYAPEATITLYQAVNEDDRLPLAAFSDAITDAIEEDVDILNISAGAPWRGPVDLSPQVQEIDRGIKNGITVVAAAGNWYPEEQEERPPVHCPAAHDGVIAVGGFVSLCDAAPGDESDHEKSGPYYVLSDGVTDEDKETLFVNTTFCGNQVCVDSGSCITNQNDKIWDLNPLPTDDKPDVYAPMHVLSHTNSGDSINIHLNGGTSFAAPIVTASLANIFTELKQQGKELPSPYEIRNAVREGAVPFGENNEPKYDDLGVRGQLL